MKSRIIRPKYKLDPKTFKLLWETFLGPDFEFFKYNIVLPLLLSVKSSHSAVKIVAVRTRLE